MQVGSVIELYTTIYGWELYNTLTEIFFDTGLMWAPILAIIYRNWKNPATSQENRAASITSLSRMQFDIYCSILVIILCIFPLSPIAINDMSFGTVCTDQYGNKVEKQINQSESTYEDNIKITDTKAPIFWHVIMSIGSGINYQAIGNMPCFEDVAWLDDALRNMSISDEKVNKEYNRFVNECYLPAKSKYEEAMSDKQYSEYVKTELENGRPGSTWWTTDYEDEDPYFMGSHFYLETPGFYKPENNVAEHGTGFRAKLPVDGWLYDSTRDKDYTPDMLANNDPGSPYCDEWWTHPTIGLKKKLFESVETMKSTHIHENLSIWETAQIIIPSVFPSTHTEETEDIFIKALSRNNNSNFAGTEFWSAADQNSKVIKAAQSGAMLLFGGAKVAGHYVEMNTLKTAAPMVQALLLMIIYMLISFVLIISAYDLKVVFSIAFLIITIKFCSVMWALSEYLYNNLFVSMFPNASFIGSVIDSDVKRVILDMILAGMFLVVPIILVAMLGLAGYSFHKFSDNMLSPAKAAGGTARSSTEGAVNAGQQIVTKGKKK